MVKWFEIFKTQKDLEQSIPKINVETKNQLKSGIPSLDNKKIEISYTVLLFCAMMFAVIFIVIYLAGYTHSETDKLTNFFATSKDMQSVSKVNNSASIDNTSKEMITKSLSNAELKKDLTNEKVIARASSSVDSFAVEIYYGKSRPDMKFMDGLKKIVKNLLNMDIDSEYVKKDKIFYIILSPLNTESEANKVIELLKIKKMISKNNGKVKSTKEVILSSIEGTN